MFLVTVITDGASYEYLCEALIKDVAINDAVRDVKKLIPTPKIESVVTSSVRFENRVCLVNTLED